MDTNFIKLNEGWNAEPNAPCPMIEVIGNDILLFFAMNPFRFPNFKVSDGGMIRFKNCSQYRMGPPNDDGWYRGECRFSKTVPDWGEFYEVLGDLKIRETPNDWKTVSTELIGSRHFLFYFRDETFECDADDWLFEPSDDNALLTRSSKLS